MRVQILRAKMADESRLVKVPLGVAPPYSLQANSTELDPELARRVAGRRFVIHVGSTIPRKRIEVLLQIFAGLKRSFPELVLVKVGGPFTREQNELVRGLNLERDVVHARFLDAHAIANLYGKAELLLQPSDAEGFGLPVIEALACGCPVVASAIPTLMEAGGTAATYCPVGAVGEWVAAVGRILSDPNVAPPVAERLKQAARFSWSEHARIIVNAYRKLAVVS
jgi:glycosyltransferase involved in cell wall biosynthesis